MASGMVLAQQVGSGTAAPEQTTTPEQQTTSTVPSYTVKDLGTLPGRTESGAFDINNTGQVVGYSGNITYPEDAHAFLYSGGQMQDLGTLPGRTESIAYSVNDSGQVVGVSLTSNETKRAFLYSDAQMYDLNDLILGDAGWTLLEARGINTSGQIVGTGVINGQTRAFLATPTTTPPDAIPPKVTSTVPKANATEVAPTANIRATFSEEMKGNTINGQTFKLFKQGSSTKVGAIVSYDASRDRAKLDPNSALQRGATYKAVVTTFAQDEAGNRLDQRPGVAGLQQKQWFFTISD
jgi:probable HAF family extracellular repeat protein